MRYHTRRDFMQLMGIGTGLAMLDGSGSTHIAADDYQGPKLRIALVGLGNYATYLAEGLKSSKYCRLTGIVTGTPGKAEKWKTQYNIPPKNIYNYQNFDQIKDNSDIDLVYIVLPNSMHKEFVIRTARAGKQVITEKPMATSVKDCEEMIAACAGAGVQLAVGYRLHYEPYHLELKRLGQEKVFGKVKLIEVSLGYRTTNPSEWRLKKALSGGGPLMNIGIYCVQASRYVTGEEPIAVTAQFGPVTNKELFAEVEESITWQLKFPGGAVATSSSSYACSVDRFYAGAEKGFFELSPAVSYGPFRGRTSNGALNFADINQQAMQMDEIAKPLLKKQKLPSHISGEEGLKDLRVMEAIYKAAATGREIIL
ncbi:MAG: Gfo/Idh/MocA family oxidoreductase [Gemmatimonadaceae bacterium]|nr:Gfo/Idh/MocA family oxidoreductase [Chitinophagaceae bacterium]